MKQLARIFMLLTFAAAGFASDESAHEGKRLYEITCSECHGLAPMERTRDGRAGWEDTVHKMVVIGTELDAEEMELVIDYLYRQYGPDRTDPMRTGVLPADSALQADGIANSDDVVLPDGQGKRLVEGLCGTCHDFGVVVASRRGRDDWQRYAANMLRQNDMSIPEKDQQIIVDYLNQHFGEVGP